MKTWQFVLSGFAGGISFVMAVLWAASIPQSVEDQSVHIGALSALVVSGATIASIGFAVITYLESSVLQNRIIKAKGEIDELNAELNREIAELSATFFAAAAGVTKGFLASLMSMPDNEGYKGSIRSLRLVEIDLRFRFGDARDLVRALDLEYKRSAFDFLGLERALWERTARFADEDKSLVRSRYLELKSNLERRARVARESRGS